MVVSLYCLLLIVYFMLHKDMLQVREFSLDPICSVETGFPWERDGETNKPQSHYFSL